MNVSYSHYITNYIYLFHLCAEIVPKEWSKLFYFEANENAITDVSAFTSSELKKFLTNLETLNLRNNNISCLPDSLHMVNAFTVNRLLYTCIRIFGYKEHVFMVLPYKRTSLYSFHVKVILT